MFGTIIIFFKHKNIKQVIGKSLSFASGVMLTVSILELIPSSVIGMRFYYRIIPSVILSLIFIIIGIIFSKTICKITISNNDICDKELYKTGIFSMLAIVLHNVPEGIATFITANADMKLGISLAIAIAFHNIPEGISISVPIYFSTGNKAKAIIYTFISGISEFLGALIAGIFLTNLEINILIYLIYSIIAGIMIGLSYYQLIPNSKNYINMKNIILYISLGAFIMMLVHTI